MENELNNHWAKWRSALGYSCTVPFCIFLYLVWSSVMLGTCMTELPMSDLKWKVLMLVRFILVVLFCCTCCVIVDDPRLEGSSVDHRKQLVAFYAMSLIWFVILGVTCLVTNEIPSATSHTLNAVLVCEAVLLGISAVFLVLFCLVYFGTRCKYARHYTLLEQQQNHNRRILGSIPERTESGIDIQRNP